MNASEALEAELVGAVCTVPHTRFLHLTPPALPVSPTICPLVRWIGRFLAPLRLRSHRAATPFDAHPPAQKGAGLRPYIQPHCLCQGREFRNPNRLTARAFQRCGAARTFVELARFQSRIRTQMSAAARLFG